MLQSCRDGCRARRASVAAGMALALAGRAAGFVPSGVRAASVRSRPLPKVVARASPLISCRSTTICDGSYRRFDRNQDVQASAAMLTGAVRSHSGSPYAHGGPLMCSVQATSSGGGTVEVPAEASTIESQIKAKGDVIRELKAAGTPKDDLKPHIEVST